ncbi:MAG: tetratricopeptide repeat protein [Chthoniobacterales bacterium]
MAFNSEKELPAPMRSTWLKATSAFELKNYGYAVQLAQTVLKQAPDFMAARQLARKSAVAKKTGKKSSFLSFSSSTFSTASFSVMKAQGLLKKDPASAMEAVEKILEGDPYNVQANQLLRDAALALNMPEIAAFALETIIEGNPKDTKQMHELARLYIDHDAPDKAVEVYNRIIEVAPHDLAAIKGGKDAAAKASMKRGGWDTAESYRDLIKDKDIAIALEQQNRVVKDDETITSLLNELHAQVTETPEDLDKIRRIAELYEQKDEIENSIEWYRHAAAMLNGADPAINRKIADLQLKQIDVCVESREDFIQQNGPESDEAQQYATEIVSLRQQRAELELGDAQDRVDRNPTDLGARFDLGEILVQAGRHQDAIQELQKARAYPSARLKAMNLLAQCYMVKNMYDLAAKTLSDAAGELIAMDSMKKEILYNLGIVYEKMGQKEKSIECMKQIYEVDYAYRDVAQRVEGSYGG